MLSWQFAGVHECWVAFLTHARGLSQFVLVCVLVSDLYLVLVESLYFHVAWSDFDVAQGAVNSDTEIKSCPWSYWPETS